VNEPDPIDAAVDDLAAELIAFRRDLHAHPELSWKEERTTGRILEALGEAGLDAQVAPTKTGVVCDLGPQADPSGPLVVLRADIDALPLTDAKDVPYRSTNDGVCHACGHDVHTAAVLGAGLALARTTPGRVRLLFQPAEETLPSGARALHDAGCATGASAILAVHCAPALEVGSVGLKVGPITSAADLIHITLRGPGGHTGRPHRTADLVHIASRIAVDLPMGMDRLTDSRDGINITFGSIHAGSAANVIPTEAHLRGTIRSLGLDTWKRSPELARDLVRSIVEPLGATWELEYQQGSPPVSNDPALTSLVAEVATQVLGPEAVQPTEQSGGGEDFSWFQTDGPGCYLRLGVRAPGAPFVDIHHEDFDVDERAIAIGARMLAHTARRVLATP
jgi:amidohydrolase